MESRLNLQNWYSEMKLVVSRAYVGKGVVHVITRLTCACVQRIHVNSIQIKVHFVTRVLKVHIPAHVFVCVYIHVVNYSSMSYPFNCIKFIETEFVIKFFLKRN